MTLASASPADSAAGPGGPPAPPIPEGACALPDWGVIRASGAEAAAFLHGQLSNDFVKLGPAQARLAAYCTAQGRMLASVIGLKRNAEELWLACPADRLAPTVRRLSMFVLRAKAKLTDASAEIGVVALAGAAAQAWLAARGAALTQPWDKADLGAASVVRLHDGAGTARYLWLGPVADMAALLSALPALDPEAWQWLGVMSGVAPITAATAEKFVPQMLNYELVGGVDFKKGCYPGQEVVARSQYLGKLKRRAFVLLGDAPMQPGQDIFWSGDATQPAGMVAAAAPAPGGGHAAVAELKLAVIDQGSLHLGAPAGPRLALGAQPVALPAEAPR